MNDIDLDGSDRDIACWIWRHLVPPSGQSLTVQGELLRAVERLRWEAQTNGNANWDPGFETLVRYLHQHLVHASTLSQESTACADADLRLLRDFLPMEECEDDDLAGSLPYIEDDLYDRLTSRVVEFSRRHPKLIAREFDPRQFR